MRPDDARPSQCIGTTSSRRDRSSIRQPTGSQPSRDVPMHPLGGPQRANPSDALRRHMPGGARVWLRLVLMLTLLVSGLLSHRSWADEPGEAEERRRTGIPYLGQVFPPASPDMQRATDALIRQLGQGKLPPAERLAQLGSFNRLGWEGFLVMAKRLNLQPVQRHPRGLLANARETVLVVAGDLSSSDTTLLQLPKFLQKGGRVLLATDRGVDRADALGSLAAWQPGPVFVSAEHAYNTYRDCPVLTSAEFPAEHPLLAGVERLVTNRPGYCTGPASRDSATQQMVVRFPQGAQGLHGPLSAEDGLVWAEEWSAGARLLQVADHSLFVNEMLLHGDNSRFALNSLLWLTAGGDCRYIIVVVDGSILADLRLGNSQLPPVSAEELSEALKYLRPEDLTQLDPATIRSMANEVIMSAEDEDVLNEVLVNQPRSVPLLNWRRGLALAAMFFLASILAIRAFLSPKPLAALPDPHRDSPPKAGESDADLPAELQELAQLTGHANWRTGQGAPPLPQGVLARTARTLVRELFLGIAEDGEPDEPWSQRSSPRFTIRQSFLARWRLQRHLKQLWGIATGDSTPIRQFRQLQKLNQQISRFRQLHAAGQLELKWR